LEVSTRAAYRYYLDKHFLPTFGHREMRLINPSQYTGTLPDAGERALAAFRRTRYGEPAPVES
jgi:hypothetical protein